MKDVCETVRNYILEKFLPGEAPELLTNATPLVTGGVLDSIATLKMASFLEQQFGIRLEAHEMSVDHLNTIDNIANLVQSKQQK